MELKDWLNSINNTKKDLLEEDPSLSKEYPPFIINKCLSGHMDSVFFSPNEMNKLSTSLIKIIFVLSKWSEETTEIFSLGPKG